MLPCDEAVFHVADQYPISINADQRSNPCHLLNVQLGADSDSVMMVGQQGQSVPLKQALSSALQTQGITIFQTVHSPAPGRLFISAVHPPYVMVADTLAAETLTAEEGDAEGETVYLVHLAICMAGGRAGEAAAVDAGTAFPMLSARGLGRDIAIMLRPASEASREVLRAQLQAQHKQQQQLHQQQQQQQQQKQWLQQQQQKQQKQEQQDSDPSQAPKLSQHDSLLQQLVQHPLDLPQAQQPLPEQDVGELFFQDITLELPLVCIEPGQVRLGPMSRVSQGWEDKSIVYFSFNSKAKHW